jgi:hypothetical protein
MCRVIVTLAERLRWAEYALTKSCGFTSFTVLAVESAIVPPPLPPDEDRGKGRVGRCGCSGLGFLEAERQFI